MLLREGEYVNLGIGLPTLVSGFVEGRGVTMHSENGILGYGGFPAEGSEDIDCYNDKDLYNLPECVERRNRALSVGAMRDRCSVSQPSSQLCLIQTVGRRERRGDERQTGAGDEKRKACHGAAPVSRLQLKSEISKPKGFTAI